MMLTDVVMRGMDGRDLAEQARSSRLGSQDGSLDGAVLLDLLVGLLGREEGSE